MSLLFSQVELSTDTESVDFLMGGIPREEDDLKNWMAYEHFVEAVDDDTEICVHAEAYLYGGGETVEASPEEVAYMYSRIQNDSDFLNTRCDNIEDVDFAFLITPDEENSYDFMEL